MLPHEGRLADSIRARLEDVVLVLFLPSFFAITGTRTQIGLLGSAQDWLVCAAIIVLATLGKFGGSFAAAKLSGIGTRRAAALGILMNTRGLMELIVLNLGLELGVITPTVFTMLVIMALVTTFSTTPVLDLLLGKRGFADEPAPGNVSPSSRA
jgi:Kef-type K+ transport system membrane component KefB